MTLEQARALRKTAEDLVAAQHYLTVTSHMHTEAVLISAAKRYVKAQYAHKGMIEEIHSEVSV